MKQIITTFLLVVLILLVNNTSTLAQANVNGQLDAIEDFSTIVTVPITMPDGTNLMTDFYIPVTSDSVMVDFELLGNNVNFQLIPRGTQLLHYDSLYNETNPNPYQLPVIFTRTPYRKNGDAAGSIISLLGYAYAIQDMRGRYESEGVYLPMLSDSWSKEPYHPEFDHVADITELDDPRNSNKHEDGYNSIQPILNINRQYDIDNDGELEEFAICNGSIGMFGASALGNTQLQMAAAHKVDANAPGLKSLAPIVATIEHFDHTGYNNGVFREQLVRGWVFGQILDMDEEFTDIDDDIDNSLHTPADYNLSTNFEVGDVCVDHFSAQQYNGIASAYPNSVMRAEMDASFAPVNETGEGEANGQFSRYGNLDVPIMHFTGWWDIFISGQIETLNKTLEALNNDNGNRDLQKIVIGPFAHQTTGSLTTGDITYKENANSFLGFNIDDIDLDDLESTQIDKIINSEAIAWYRYTLNERQGLGEPKVIIPASNTWQDLGDIGQARIPSQDYVIKFTDLLNLLGNVGELPPITVEIENVIGTTELEIPLPDFELGDFGFQLEEPIESLNSIDYTQIPAFRYYMVGPINDGIPDNEEVGNYWMASEHFPLTGDDGIISTKMYLQQNGELDFIMPENDGELSYTHDPDNPVRTVGGANMIVKTPDDARDSQGQMNLANPDYAPFTLNNDGVLQFTGPEISDSMTIVGMPTATIYAASNPVGAESGPTDTDFFVRILDVYPDGSEYFVVEGAVNARAREYARSIAQGNKDIDAPYSNINIGEIYEYQFKLLPIAYTWGKGHRIKVLISSSNWTRYQVNPNLPIEDNEFFRRQPGDGQTYTYNGEVMSPRVAEQNIYMSPAYPSSIELPFYNQNFTIVDVNEPTNPNNEEFAIIVSPNPASNIIHLTSLADTQNVDYAVYSSAGQLIQAGMLNGQTTLNCSNWTSGVYIIEFSQEKNTVNKRVIVE